MKKPDKNYYVVKQSYYLYKSNNSGFRTDTNIMLIELIANLRQKHRWVDSAGNSIIFRLGGSNGDIVWWGSSFPFYYFFFYKNNVVDRTIYFYPNLYDFDVYHIVIAGTPVYLYGDGIKFVEVTLTNPLVFPDPVAVHFASNAQYGLRHDLCGVRIWQFSSLPNGWQDEVVKRARNPWQRSRVFGDSNLKAEWLLNEDISVSSTVIPNSANPGTGDLPIYPSNTWGNVRQLYKTP